MKSIKEHAWTKKQVYCIYSRYFYHYLHRRKANMLAEVQFGFSSLMNLNLSYIFASIFKQYLQ